MKYSFSTEAQASFIIIIALEARVSTIVINV